MKKNFSRKRFFSCTENNCTETQRIKKFFARSFFLFLSLLLWLEGASISWLNAATSEPSTSVPEPALSDINPENKNNEIKTLLRKLTGKPSSAQTKIPGDSDDDDDGDAVGAELGIALDTSSDDIAEGSGLQGLADKLAALKEKLQSLLRKVTGAPESKPAPAPEQISEPKTKAPGGDTGKDTGDEATESEKLKGFDSSHKEFEALSSLTPEKLNELEKKVIAYQDVLEAIKQEDGSTLSPREKMLKALCDPLGEYYKKKDALKKLLSQGILSPSVYKKFDEAKQKLSNLLNEEDGKRMTEADYFFLEQSSGVDLKKIKEHKLTTALTITDNADEGTIAETIAKIAQDLDGSHVSQEEAQKIDQLSIQKIIDKIGALRTNNLKIDNPEIQSAFNFYKKDIEWLDKLSEPTKTDKNSKIETLKNGLAAQFWMHVALVLLDHCAEEKKLIRVYLSRSEGVLKADEKTSEKLSDDQNNYKKIEALVTNDKASLEKLVNDIKNKETKINYSEGQSFIEAIYQATFWSFKNNKTPSSPSTSSVIIQDAYKHFSKAAETLMINFLKSSQEATNKDSKDFGSSLAQWAQDKARLVASLEGHRADLRRQSTELEKYQNEKKREQKEKENKSKEFAAQINEDLSNITNEINALITQAYSENKTSETRAPLLSIAALRYCYELLDIQKVALKKNHNTGLPEEIKTQLTNQINSLVSANNTSDSGAETAEATAKKNTLEQILSYLQELLGSATTLPTQPTISANITDPEEKLVVEAIATHAENLARHFKKNKSTETSEEKKTEQERMWRLLKNNILSEIERQATEYKKQYIRAEHTKKTTKTESATREEKEKKVKQFSSSLEYIAAAQEKLYNAVTNYSSSEGGSYTNMMLLSQQNTSDQTTELGRLFQLPHGDNFLESIKSDNITASMDKEWLRRIGEAASDYYQLLQQVTTLVPDAQLPSIIIKKEASSSINFNINKISVTDYSEKLKTLLKKIQENFEQTTIKSFFKHLADNNLEALDHFLLNATDNKAQEELRAFVDQRGQNLIHLLMNYGQINSDQYYKDHKLIPDPTTLKPGVDQGRSVIDWCKQLITRLITIGVNVHHENNRGLTPLAAALEGSYNKYLFAPLSEAGAWEYTSSDKKQNLLHVLTSHHKLSEYRDDSRFADGKWYYIEGRVFDGMTRTAPEKILELLKAPDAAGLTPFDYALMHNDQRAIDALLLIASRAASETTSTNPETIKTTEEPRKKTLNNLHELIKNYKSRMTTLSEEEKTTCDELVGKVQGIVDDLITTNNIATPSNGHVRGS